MSNLHKARCSCGAIQLEMSGEPVVQVYCHCTKCRGWSTAPVMACVLWPADAVHVTCGKEHLFQAPGGGAEACNQCGGGVKAELSGAGLTDVFAGIIQDFTFEPSAHINYENHVLAIKDGLPKFADMPEDAGGSGTMMPE